MAFFTGFTVQPRIQYANNFSSTRPYIQLYDYKEWLESLQNDSSLIDNCCYFLSSKHYIWSTMRLYLVSNESSISYADQRWFAAAVFDSSDNVVNSSLLFSLCVIVVGGTDL